MIPQSEIDEKNPQSNSNDADIRREILALHNDLAQAMRYLGMIASAVSDLRGFTAQLAARLPSGAAAPAAHPTPQAQRCHACGAEVTRHPAPAGVLLLCSRCGWSEFVARDGSETAEVRPEAVPPCPTTNTWAA